MRFIRPDIDEIQKHLDDMIELYKTHRATSQEEEYIRDVKILLDYIEEIEGELNSHLAPAFVEWYEKKYPEKAEKLKGMCRVIDNATLLRKK